MEIILILVLLVAAVFLLPARYDHAIRLKEWTEKKDE